MKLPFALATDREAIETAAALYDPATLRMAVIDDTLHMGRVWLSESLIDEARGRADLTVNGAPAALSFGADGALAPS
jgi:hypothetical protein